MKTSYISIVVALLACLSLSSCHGYDKYADDPYGNFDCLWDEVDRNYCFFGEKDVDWDEVRQRYRSRIVPDATSEELFRLFAEMLDELRDGHVNLASSFNVSYYRKWWSDYPQDYDARTVEQYYLNFNYHSLGSIIYEILPCNVGYIHYSTFMSLPGEGNLDNMLAYLSGCDALIIDIRDNGGGLLTNIEPFVRRLVHDRTRAGYVRHKTGPGHDEFSDWYPIDYDPAPKSRVVWNKPVAVLTNRSCFSAANAFACVMKEIPGVKLVGARTGGGGGLPFTSELPNGWSVRFSASPMADVRMKSIEEGIDPSEGCEVHATSLDFCDGRDPIIDRAIQILTNDNQQ